MRVSAATNYAARALVELAATSPDSLPLHVIAERQQISHGFLEHIFRDLRAAGLVLSQRGGHGHGGYRLNVPATELTLAAVVAATRPTDTSSPPDCAAHSCGHQPLDAVWARLEEQITAYLSGVTIADLAAADPQPLDPSARIER